MEALDRTFAATPMDFTNTLVHEARHACQDYTAGLAGNDDDNDYLVNAIVIAPATIFLDTTQPRTTCNDPAGFPGIPVVQAYSGDTVFDAWANVILALEEDAVAYAQN
jgi:hypothetical protein